MLLSGSPGSKTQTANSNISRAGCSLFSLGERAVLEVSTGIWVLWEAGGELPNNRKLFLPCTAVLI